VRDAWRAPGAPGARRAPPVFLWPFCLDLCAREPQGLSTVNRGAGRRGEMSGPREGDPMTRLDRRPFMRAAAAGAAVTASGGLRLPDASASTRQAAYRGPRATRVLPSLPQAGPELPLPAGFPYK